MKLHLKERLYLLQVLPQQNTFMDFAIKSKIKSKVSITEDDVKFYELSEDANTRNLTWNLAKDMEKPIEVSFTADEIEYIKKGCESLMNSSFPDDFWKVVERIYEAQ